MSSYSQSSSFGGARVFTDLSSLSRVSAHHDNAGAPHDDNDTSASKGAYSPITSSFHESKEDQHFGTQNRVLSDLDFMDMNRSYEHHYQDLNFSLGGVNDSTSDGPQNTHNLSQENEDSREEGARIQSPQNEDQRKHTIPQPDRYLPHSIAALSREELIARLRRCQEALNDRELQLLEEQTRSMQELENLRSVLHEREKTIRTQSKELKTVRDAIEGSQLHYENVQLKKRVKHAEKKLELTKQRLKENEQSSSGLIEQLRTEKEQLHQERDELWKRNQKDTNNIRSLEATLQKKVSTLNELSDEKDKALIEKQKLQELLSETKRILRRVRDREDANAAALRGQNGTIAQLRRQFEESEAEQEKLQNQVESLKASLEEKKSELKEYKASLYDIKSDYEEKNESFKQAEQTAKELSDTKKKLEETKTELFQVQEQFQQKKYEDEKMIKRLRNTVADKEQIIEGLKKQESGDASMLPEISDSQSKDLRAECEGLSRELHYQKQLTEEARKEANLYMEKAQHNLKAVSPEKEKSNNLAISNHTTTDANTQEYLTLLTLIGIQVLPAVERLCRLVESVYSKQNFALDELLQLQEDEMSDIQENGEITLGIFVDSDNENHFISFVEPAQNFSSDEGQCSSLDVANFVSQLRRLVERVNGLRYKLADHLAGTSAEEQCRMQ